MDSPENGINEINELLRSDGPCMSEALDLEFLMNKDVTNSYFYNDLVNDYMNDQQEESSLLSDLQFGDFAGTASENFHHDVDLSETNLIHNQEEGYIPNDFFKVEPDSVQSQIENKVPSPISQFVVEGDDGNLDEESRNISTSICNEKTSPLQCEMTRSDQSKVVLYEDHLNADGNSMNETMMLDSERKIADSKSSLATTPETASSFKKRHSRSQSRSPERHSDNRLVVIDNSPGQAQRTKGGSSSKSSGYDVLKHDSIGRSLSSVATRCPMPYYEGRNPTSPRGSGKRPKISSLKPPVSPRHHQSYKGHRVTDRPRSASPTKQRIVSSGYKRGSHCISWSRSPRRRDNHQKRQRYSPRRRTPPPPPSTKHRSNHSSPPRRRDFGSGKQPGRCLFVAGFCFRTTERDLERKFSRFGRVRDIRVIRDRRSGDSRGFGFLTLERDEDADAAIRTLHNTDWNGRVILVEKSNGPS